jgi:hypothetical protein
MLWYVLKDRDPDDAGLVAELGGKPYVGSSDGEGGDGQFSQPGGRSGITEGGGSPVSHKGGSKS